jgi:hypothetical protein
MWSDRPLEKVTFADLLSLVDNKVREDRQLDYKDEQPAHAKAPPDKKSEFAVDVSALANGSGGLLIYGVAEEKENDRPTGIPNGLNGLAGFNLDADGNQLRNYLDAALDPKLATGSVELCAVGGGARGPILLVRVHRSFAAPHMVRAEGRFRNSFYLRDGARNRQLDARAIREAVMASGDWMRRFREWRRDRVATVLAGETPIALESTRRLILHVAAISSLENEAPIDMREALRRSLDMRVAAFGSPFEYRSESFNVDGMVIYSRAKCLDYLQVFRSGSIETVDVTSVSTDEKLNSRAIEEKLFADVPRYVSYLQSLGIVPPIIVALTLTGVRGLHHAEQHSIDRARRTVPTIDRDVVSIPELFIDAEQIAKAPQMYLAPIINSLWQAGGHAGCPRYRDDGTYDRARTCF